MTDDDRLQAVRIDPASDQSPSTTARLAGVVRRSAALGGVWLVLAGSGAEALILGVLLVPSATWLSLWLIPGSVPVRLGALITFAPGFIWRSLTGGLDVAWRAFHPHLPIRPGWIELAVVLPDGGRVALGGELSLMPGTLAAGCQGHRLLIHVLDRDQDMETIVRDEEHRIARALNRARVGQGSA